MEKNTRTTSSQATPRRLRLRLRAVPVGRACHAERAADTYGLDTRAILVEVGRRKLVGGQEDMIVDVALDLVAARDAVAV